MLAPQAPIVVPTSQVEAVTQLKPNGQAPNDVELLAWDDVPLVCDDVLVAELPPELVLASLLLPPPMLDDDDGRCSIWPRISPAP